MMIKAPFFPLVFGLSLGVFLSLANAVKADPDEIENHAQTISEQCVALQAGYKGQLGRGDAFATEYDPLIADYDQAKEALDKALAANEDAAQAWEKLHRARTAALPGVQGYGLVIRGIFAAARNAIEAHCIAPDGNPAKARTTEAGILQEIAQKLAQMKAIPDDINAYKAMHENPPATP